MKRILVMIYLLTFLQVSFGQSLIQFKVSKPYSIFNFLETATNQQGTSSTLNEYIHSRTKGDTAFSNISNAFKNLQIDYNYKRSEFPENRRQNRSTKDLIKIALVNSNTLEEFKNTTIGILPNSEQQKMISVLKRTEHYFDTLIWNNYEQNLGNQKTELEKYASKASEIFYTFQHFYNSTWTADIPFNVALYSIPGKEGNSTASASANSLSIGVFTDRTQPLETMGVVLHEMCHVLYDEQSKEFQHQIEKWFNQNKSVYKQFAYNFFDEGLATALGNGWAFKYLNGSIDPGEWYNNEYINGFGKALFPLVKKYIDKNTAIDQQFIDEATDIFARKFPKAIYDYGILLNRVSIYSDAETEAESNDLLNTISDRFQLTNVMASSPILDKTSLELLKNSTQTQLIIIDKNYNKNFDALNKVFPQLSKINSKISPAYTILSFYDKMNKAVIILSLKDRRALKEVLEKMKTQKYFDRKNTLQ